jgi:hypothetical protein
MAPSKYFDLVVLYYLGSFEFWPAKRGGLVREGLLYILMFLYSTKILAE